MPEKPKGKKKFAFSGLYIVAAIAVLWAYDAALHQKAKVREVPYSELIEQVEAGSIERVKILDTKIEAFPKSADRAEDSKAKSPSPMLVAKRLPRMDESKLIETLRQHGVVIIGEAESGSWWMPMLYWMLPILVLFGPYLFGMRMLGKGGGPLSFGKNRIKVHDTADNEKTTFADVAGIEEVKEEIQEVVEFLRDNEKYKKLGAKVPKGVLLVGPPGTGKTLLAKAIAGEAGVPFFSMSGSEFVEMFVGVGAARVRELFEQAKKRAPCIVFIDEIDAIGRARGGVAAMATHDEREQTLNQLLTEMDGFDSSTGVVIMAATNRPEVLDQALVRPGRFDRRVVVDAPDVEGRLAILAVHIRDLPLHDDVDLDVVAQLTPGMVGADLAKIANEAALMAARRGSEKVCQKDFEEAVEKTQLGLKRRGRVMNEKERRRVAFHEAGHALVALSAEHADPVHKVTIIPRSIGALGVTLQLPTEDRYLMTESELRDQIAVMLGGRAAEEIKFSEVSTGAQNDLERATELAKQMVCRFGMSKSLGPRTFGRSEDLTFLKGPFGVESNRDYSELKAQEIDAEITEILAQEGSRALEILQKRQHQLEAVAGELLTSETIDRDTLARLTDTPVTAVA